MSDYDFSGLTNPKRVIERRLERAEGVAHSTPGPASAPGSRVRFEKPRTEAEKAAHREALARKLRSMGELPRE